MFQFTTTTVINSAKDYTNPSVELFKGDSKYFDVKRVNRFKVKNIRSVYKQDPVAQSNAKATIDMAKVKETLTANKATKGTFRVEIYVHLAQSNNNPLYSNTWVVKGRPWTFEFSATSTEDAGNIVDKVIKMINKFKLFTMDTEQLKATKDTTKLVLTAQDPYQIFSKVKISIFLSLSRQLLILLPLLAFLPMIWDIDGVWYSMPISDFAAAVIAGVVMMWYMNKLKRQHQEQLKVNS